MLKRSWVELVVFREEIAIVVNIEPKYLFLSREKCAKVSERIPIFLYSLVTRARILALVWRTTYPLN